MIYVMLEGCAHWTINELYTSELPSSENKIKNDHNICLNMLHSSFKWSIYSCFSVLSRISLNIIKCQFPAVSQSAIQWKVNVVMSGASGWQMTDVHGTAAFIHYQQFIFCFKYLCTYDLFLSKWSILDKKSKKWWVHFFCRKALCKLLKLNFHL